jgi:hypothetical protein
VLLWVGLLWDLVSFGWCRLEKAEKRGEHSNEEIDKKD